MTCYPVAMVFRRCSSWVTWR